MKVPPPPSYEEIIVQDNSNLYSQFNQISNQQPVIDSPPTYNSMCYSITNINTCSQYNIQPINNQLVQQFSSLQYEHNIQQNSPPYPIVDHFPVPQQVYPPNTSQIILPQTNEVLESLVQQQDCCPNCKQKIKTPANVECIFLLFFLIGFISYMIGKVYFLIVFSIGICFIIFCSSKANDYKCSQCNNCIGE